METIQISTVSDRYRVVNSLFIQYGQRAGHSQVDSAGLRIGFGTKCGAGTRENFGFGG